MLNRKNKLHVTPSAGFGMWQGMAAMLLTFAATGANAQEVSQTPLSIGTGAPGNLLLVPSVEWPTIDSVANLGTYSPNTLYVGYFDSNKCYQYSYSDTETERHFFPHRTTTDRTCTRADKEWSGNYLNWATTQTIDPFRKALTGGYRVKDTSSETILEKARSDNNTGTGIFPDRRIPAGTAVDTTLVQGATPAQWDLFRTRIRKLGNKMWFSNTGLFPDNATTVAYDPDTYQLGTSDTAKGRVYEVSVRVKVCVANQSPEPNCEQYGSNYKPEGLIQKYSEDIRYSVFGYLNDSSITGSTPNRDGGVLRAKQKFVGPQELNPTTRAWEDNTAKEWSSTTGVFVRNPDAADATATTAAVGAGQTIADSGVINYINKFGQMTTQNHKSFDPVSELYYTALRYLRNKGNVPAYSNFTGADAAANYNQADGFPVITTWDDPIQYRCQNNAILGIGDVNTHRDKNLPGNSRSDQEPTKPTEVAGDYPDVDVLASTNKVAAMEGFPNGTMPLPFSGRENSAYIAGMAYEAHTTDMRPEDALPGKQTVSTHWVDVREAETLYGPTANQYWLAAKYGGFTVPTDFDYATRTAALPSSWWNTGNDTLTPTTPANAAAQLRPDNFYVASEASKMVESLTRAFAKIAAEAKGSASSLASNSTRLDTGAQTFQAQFVSGTWRGDVRAFSVDPVTGALSTAPIWTASQKLAATTWSARNIRTHSGTAYRTFTWDNLSTAQQTALGSQNVVDYLRGDRSREDSQTGGTLRTRTSVLGDIVNSSPVYVGRPIAGLYAGASFNGASAYSAFAATTRTPVVYVGANDGMLHGFNAGTDPATQGAETFAYVPRTVIANNLKSLSDPDYEHKYFVDGELAVADVYDTNATRWRTVLVGTLGRGGPGIFALDVTDPTDVTFLWEKGPSDIAALGKNIGKPVIAQVGNGDWRVILGNGPGSPSEDAQLIMIGAVSGTVTTITTGNTDDNGLSAVLARDTDGDRFTDTIYAGDLRGKLWKFTNLTANNPSVATLFTATDGAATPNPQPITAAPLAGKDPTTGITWVFFGTGQYLGEPDLANQSVQTWYGVKDQGTNAGTRSNLVQRTITAEGTIAGFGARVISDGNVSQLLSQNGWFIDLKKPPDGLAEGERMVVPNRFQGAALIGTTRIPDGSDVCEPSGRGWIMAINPFTGARLDQTFFDMNRDGTFNGSDMLNNQIVSAIGFGEGVAAPIFIGDKMYVNGDDGDNGGLGGSGGNGGDGDPPEKFNTQGGAATSERMNWREVLN